MAYAMGDLSHGLSIAVATHVSMCERCRAEVESYETLGGVLLEESVAAPIQVTSTVDQIIVRANEVQPEPIMKAAASRAEIPAPLNEYCGLSFDTLKWRKIGMGVRQLILCDDGESSARLLYIPAGTGMPDHGHSGLEMTLVLRGAFLDGEARFAAGDIEEADDETEHRPVADLGEDCICLAANEGALQFKSLVPRLMQPLLRI